MNSVTSTVLNDIAIHWASWMITMSWQVTLLVALLWAIGWCLKGRSASLLYAIWLLVLIRLMLPPDLTCPTGWGWWLRTGNTASTAQATHQGGTQSSLYAATDLATNNGVPSEAELRRATVRSRVLLMIGWLGIAAARGGMLFTAALQVRVWVARAGPILDPELLGILDHCRQRVGVRRAVELRNSEACSTPLVVGLWRPVLLLPSAVLERLTKEQLRSVLIHELHHVKRWDSAVNLLQGILGAIYFFHPVVWLANRHLRQLREDACDERTVAVLEGSRKPYGEAIFAVAEILGYAAPPLTLGVLDSPSSLKQRLARILDPRLPTEGGLNWVGVLFLVVAAALLLPAGARPSSRSESLPDTAASAVKEFPVSQPDSTFEQGQPGDPSDGAGVRGADSWEGLRLAATPERQDSAEPIRSVQDLARDLLGTERREAAVAALIELGPSVESALIEHADVDDYSMRLAIYKALEMIGTEASLLPLQQFALRRTAAERPHIERALDAIYGRMTTPSPDEEPTVNNLRIFE